MKHCIWVLGITYSLIIHLTVCAPSTKTCADPHIEIQNTQWDLYINLIPTDVHACKVKKVTERKNCSDKHEVLSIEPLTYFDITNNCIDLANQSNQVTPNSFTLSYTCNKGQLSTMTVTKNITATSTKAGVNPASDQLYLPSGTLCKFSMGFCYDSKQNFRGYVWQTKLPNTPLATNLVKLYLPRSITVAVKLTLDKSYIVLERNDKAVAVELAEALEVRGAKMWTDNKGFFVTNNTLAPLTNTTDNRFYLFLTDKQKVYESLIGTCGGNDDLFYFYTTIALLTYVSLHFIICVYNHLINCRTFQKVNGGFGRWMFQSWINSTFINAAVEREIHSKSDIEKKLNKQSIHSYYELRIPHDNKK